MAIDVGTDVGTVVGTRVGTVVGSPPQATMRKTSKDRPKMNLDFNRI